MKVLFFSLMCFAVVLSGCATEGVPAAEEMTDWAVTLEGEESAVVTSDEAESSKVETVQKNGYEGILLSTLSARVDGDSGPDLWESGFEITITASDGYAVTVDTQNFAPDDLMLVFREEADSVLPFLYGQFLPRDMAVKDVVKVEVHLPLQETEKETALVLEIITDEQTKQLTIDQLDFFILDGMGGYTTSAGTYNESEYRGIDIGELVLSLGYGAEDSMAAVALDGFEMTYALEVIIDDPEGTWILAYLQDGKLLPDGIGPFRVIKIGDPVPNIPGNQSARMVSAIRLF